jgi:CTP:molybdopterin cytidylyltransferase MocA
MNQSDAPSPSSPILRVDVVLPAGGSISGDFAAASGVTNKALIVLDGKTILCHIIATLRETGCIGRIVVIGSEAAQAEAGRCGAEGALPEGDSGPENIFRGLEWLRANPETAQATRVLIVTTDLPLLTADSIRRFLALCPPEADLAIPVVSRASFESLYPDTGSVWVRLREGDVTLGCAFLVNPETLLKNQAHIHRVFEARKSNLAMARLLGLPFILRYLVGRLSVAHIEQRCRQILRCAGVAVWNAPPELAFDLDAADEYAYISAFLARKERDETLP